MLPQEFELYGSRFQWLEADSPIQSPEPCISLIRSSQPLSSEAVVWLSHSEADKLWFGKCGDSYAYRFENIGEFQLPADGSFIQAFLDPEAPAWAVDFVLCRGVIPRLLHLRGITCLHAGAVAIEDRVVAFCGPSGSGKSTLAAALAARGYPVITDDVLPLRASSSGVILAGPGLPDIRVHPATAVRIGIADRVTLPVSGQTKSVWRPESFVTTALPLAGIYMLEWRGPAFLKSAGAVPLSPSDALLSLLYNSFWLDPAETGALATDLTRIAQVVRGVPISRLSFEIGETGFDFVDRLISNRLISGVPVCR